MHVVDLLPREVNPVPTPSIPINRLYSAWLTMRIVLLPISLVS